jgi:hypothetical protein
VSEVLDHLAAERSQNVALRRPAQIQRAREYLEAAGLGHLRPDKSWRPRSWRDRLAAVPYPEDRLVEKLAEAVYSAHWREPSPRWDAAAESYREWSRAQARAALAALREF